MQHRNYDPPTHRTPMPRLSALMIPMLAMPAVLAAQDPYRHFTEAVAVRTSATQPVVSYLLSVNPEDLSGYSVELRIRNAPDTLRLAMAAHPEYDDRYWRYVDGPRVESNGH